MDIHPYTPHKAHDEMLTHHRATWHGIGKLATYMGIGIVVLLVLMATFLVHRSIG